MLSRDKKVCAVCSGKLGLVKYKIKDGDYICSSCYSAAKFSDQVGPRGFDSVGVTKRIRAMEENEKRLSSFTVTKEVGDFLKIDENAKLWYTAEGKEKKRKIVHRYEDIVDYELIDNGATTVSGGMGNAIAGGVMFGAVGAVVGGTTAKRKQSDKCTELKIKITLNDITEPTVYINFISGEMKRNGTLYKIISGYAQECVSLLQVIYESVKPAPESAPAPISEADELKKFKELLDSGVITQEEFDAKKKQILGV